MVWWDQHPNVYWDTRSVTSNSLRAVQDATKIRGNKLRPGEKIIATNPHLRDPEAEMPTVMEWLQMIENGSINGVPEGAGEMDEESLDNYRTQRGERIRKGYRPPAGDPSTLE